MRRYTFIILVAGLVFSTTTAAHALTIDIDYSLDTNGFFGVQARRDTLRDAADFFESILTDDLDAIIPDGVNSWSMNFAHPATGSLHTINNPSVAADTLVIYVGGRNLGGTRLGIGGPGGWSASGYQDWFDTLDFRGETPNSNLDFAPWGGMLAFDSVGTNWYFDSDTSTDESFAGTDFYSVAIHEMGHILGYGTSDSWYYDVSGGYFYGADSMAVNGGPVELYDYDAHWDDYTYSTIGGAGSFEAAMGPYIASGDRQRFTDLDVAGLSDIGWDVIPLESCELIADIAPVASGGDGIVDGADLGALLARWKDTGASVADIAPVASGGDGIVDGADLGALLARWKDTCDTPAAPVGEPVGIDDGSDLGAFLVRWRDPSLPTIPVIPEPATMTLLALGSLAIIRRRSR